MRLKGIPELVGWFVCSSQIFWDITFCYNWSAGMRGMHHPTPTLSAPRTSRKQTYQQAVVQLCPQFPVDNLASTNKVFKYLWISIRQLNIMVVVLSRIGKTLGFGRFAWGGEGWSVASEIGGAPPPPKKQNGLESLKPIFPKGKKWKTKYSALQQKKRRKRSDARRVRSR